MGMSTILQISAAQLRHAAEVQTKIEALQAELSKVLGGSSSPGKVATARVATVARVKAPRRRRRLSAAGRARIVAASKAYWAKRRAGAKPAKAKAKRKKLSAAVRAKLAAIAKARWAKVKAAGKSRL